MNDNSPRDSYSMWISTTTAGYTFSVQLADDITMIYLPLVMQGSDEDYRSVSTSLLPVH